MTEHDDEIPPDDKRALEETSTPDMTEASDEQSSARAMTLKQLQEALQDESHPRHDEAVERNKELSEQLRPAMDSLRKAINKSFDFSNAFKNFKSPTAEQLRMLSLSKTISEQLRMPSLGKTISQQLRMPSLDKTISEQLRMPSLDKTISQQLNLGFPKANYVQPGISRSELPQYEPISIPDFKRTCDDIAEASRIKSERAQRQLEALEGLWATMMQVQSENKKSSRLNTWLVGLTLIATVGGIVTSVVLALMT